MMTPDLSVSCVLTGFSGSEERILRLRNSNRENPETLEYLRWRYESFPGVPDPRVFWLKSADGEWLGMATAIFRPYLVDGKRAHIAVIGDISVDARHRRLGLGQMLLRFMTSDLDAHFPEGLALVIPTDSARRTLGRVGWTRAGELGSLVYVLDPGEYLRRVLRHQPLAASLARPLRALARHLARRHARAGGSLRLDTAPDATTYEFLDRLPPGNQIRRALPPGSLEWRYTRHPHSRFTFATYRVAAEVRGLLIFEEASVGGTCSIYDLFAISDEDMRAMAALFVMRCAGVAGLTTVRVALDGAHPARASLRGVGFIPRPAEAVFQVHSFTGKAEHARWRITQGDKDT